MKINPNLSILKSAIFTRTLLLTTALLFSILTCSGKNDPSDNKYQVEFAGDDEIDVWGSYVISGSQFTFNDEGGEYGSDAAGVYEFQVSDISLTFTEVNDPVYGRRSLVEGSWSKASDVEK